MAHHELGGGNTRTSASGEATAGALDLVQKAAPKPSRIPVPRSLERLTCPGDASVGVIRGTARHMFDLAFEVTWEAGIGGVSKPAKGSLKFSDFGDAAALSTDDVQCEFAFADEKRVPAEHRAAVRREVGGGAGDGAGCAAGKTLAGDVLAKLVAEFIPAFNAL